MKIGTNCVWLIALALACGCEERVGDLPILERAPLADRFVGPALMPATRVLTEAQSVDVLSTLDHGEIELARYALGRARQQQTRDLAQMTIDRDTEAQANVARWAQSASIAAAPNDVTPTIARGMATVRASLDGTADDPFDATYVRSQVELHQDALRILDERILPGAHDPQFRSLVTTIRAGVATDLFQARAVADALRG